MKEVLLCKDLTMSFGGVKAVQNVNISVNEGETVVLIGPNGAGKTTVINLITGIYRPTSGSIYFNGEVINTKEDNKVFKKKISLQPFQIARKGIARTFQNIRLFKELTLLENIKSALHNDIKSNFFTTALGLNKSERKKIEEKALMLIKELELENDINKIVSELPYGTQRKVEIARSLAINPTLLLLDEPAAGMNEKETAELADFIKVIKKKFSLTIIAIEHHMSFVKIIADRVYVLDTGAVIAEGSYNEVINNKDVITAYLGENRNE